MLGVPPFFDNLGGPGTRTNGEGILSVPSDGTGGDGGGGGKVSCCKPAVISLCAGSCASLPTYELVAEFVGIGLGGGVGGISTSRECRGVVSCEVCDVRGLVASGFEEGFRRSSKSSLDWYIAMKMAATIRPEKGRPDRSLPHIRQNRFSRR